MEGRLVIRSLASELLAINTVGISGVYLVLIITDRAKQTQSASPRKILFCRAASDVRRRHSLIVPQCTESILVRQHGNFTFSADSKASILMGSIEYYGISITVGYVEYREHDIPNCQLT